MSEHSSVDIRVADASDLFGPGDALLKEFEAQYPQVSVAARGDQVQLSGPAEQVAAARKLLDQMAELVARGQRLTPDDFRRSASMLAGDASARPADVLSQSILSSRGKSIRPKTLGQKNYVDAIDRNTIVFGIGPAGTGKTYLAMAKAVQA